MASRTSPVSPAPVRDPLQLNELGIITNPNWLAWFERVLWPTLASIQGLQIDVFSDAEQRDSESAIREQIEAAREGDNGRLAGDLEDLARDAAAVEPVPPYDDSDLRVLAAFTEQAQRWEDELANLVALADVSRPATEQVFLAGSHADRIAKHPAAAYPDGSRYWESDRKVTYIAVSKAWKYVSGTMSDTLANTPGDLGADDEGFLLHVTTGTAGVEYNHLVRWDGTGWEAAPGHAMGGFFQDWPETPIDKGWHPCDGTATKKLTIVAGALGEANFTTPDLTTGVYRKGGAYTGTVNSAGTLGIAGNTGATSGGTPAGTVSQPTLSMDSYTPSGTVSQSTFTGDLGATSVNTGNHTFPLGTGATITVASDPHTHTITPTGTVSQPTFSGSPATLTGTVSQPSFTGDALAGHTHDFSAATVSLTGGDAVKNIAVPVHFRR